MEWNLADLFESVAGAVPRREAVVVTGPTGRELSLSYRQLDERATRLAGALAARGVGPDGRVGLLLRNGNEYLEGMLACFKLRALAVNVNHRYVAEELHDLFVHSGTQVVIHEPDLEAVVAEARDGVTTMTGPAAALARGPAYEGALDGAPPVPDTGPRSGDDRYVLYTGGTTGRPKGVLWRQEDLFFAALGGDGVGGDLVSSREDVLARARRGRTRCLAASPFMHGTGHWMAMSTLLSGGTVIATRSRQLDAEALWDAAGSESASFLVIVGDAFARPLIDALERWPGRWDLSALTVVLSGGAILSATVKEELLRLLPAVIVVDGFGASETGGQGQAVAVHGAPVAGLARFRMAPDTAVLDEQMRPLEPGDDRIGWLARRGRIPLGYLNDPDATARTFPVVDGVRWAVPGDLARVEADGSVVVFGRGSLSISSGGEKVHPEEVESTLKAHPAVFDAVVVGVPHRRWGEQVAAVVQARPGAAPTLHELAEHCRTRLAGFKVPRRLVVVDRLVRSASGKPDYRWARRTAADGGGSAAETG